MVPPTPLTSHSQKDPRNIRDKAYQQTLRNTIFAWLQESQFQGTISKQTVTALSTSSPTVGGSSTASAGDLNPSASATSGAGKTAAGSVLALLGAAVVFAVQL